MRFTYTVPKAKYNRIAYRIGSGIFLAIALIQIIVILNKSSSHPMLTAFFAVLLGGYGVYLLHASLRKNAFDITYVFSEDGMLVKHHYGDTLYTFDDIEFITMVIADENLTCYILNIKAKKDIYIIPFTMKGALCEKIYEFVHSRIKHTDDDEA